jgi:SAM-dependent methyltransferase
MHLTRHYMHKAIRSCLEEHRLLPIRGEVLGISGINHFYPLIDFEHARLTETDYPEVDMQSLPFETGTFDFCISDQILEHLEDPGKALAESRRVLREGGISLQTTCFMNFLHRCPRDFWRFSPEALEFLCRDFREILCSGGWGNRIAILLCFLSNRFRFMSIPEGGRGLRSLIAESNEGDYPIVTWVVAKK